MRGDAPPDGEAPSPPPATAAAPSAGAGHGPAVDPGAAPVRGPRPAPPPPRDRGVPAPHLEWGRPTEPVAPAPALWRDPVRAAIGIACVVIPIAVVQPTATGSTPFDGPVSADALSGVNDGTLLVFVVTAMALVTFWRAAAESDHLVVGLLPLILGIGAVLEFGLVVQAAQLAIADWTRRGGSGTLTGAIYVLGAAVAVLVVGGAILTWRWRRRSLATRSAG